MNKDNVHQVTESIIGVFNILGKFAKEGGLVLLLFLGLFASVAVLSVVIFYAVKYWYISIPAIILFVAATYILNYFTNPKRNNSSVMLYENNDG